MQPGRYRPCRSPATTEQCLPVQGFLRYSCRPNLFHNQTDRQAAHVRRIESTTWNPCPSLYVYTRSRRNGNLRSGRCRCPHPRRHRAGRVIETLAGDIADLPPSPYSASTLTSVCHERCFSKSPTIHQEYMTGQSLGKGSGGKDGFTSPE